MLFKRTICALIALVTVIISCDNDTDDEPTPTDTIKPTVTITSPSAGGVVTAGDNLFLQMICADNVVLGSARIKIFRDEEYPTLSGQWEYDATVDIFSRGPRVINLKIPVPVTADSGIYSVAVSLLDTKRNRAEDTVTFAVYSAYDTIPPQINLTAPNHAGRITIPPGASISILGSVTDNKAISRVDLELFHEKSYTESRIDRKSFNVALSHSLNEVFVIPNGLVNADLKLVIRTMDVDGNISRQEFFYHVSS